MPYLATNDAELWLVVPGYDDLLLTGEASDTAGANFFIEAIDDGATWDSPVPIDVAVQRWMADGAVTTTQGHDDRTPSFQVRISANTSADLAAGEAALVKRSGRPALLRWIPPQGDPDAPASVFEVWTWHLEHAFDGIDERNLRRAYTLTFTAKPWVRSDDLTVVDALPSVAVPTVVSIDTCSSITGWAGNPNGPSTSGGAVIESSTISGGAKGVTGGLSLTRTGLVTMGSQPYLAITSTFVGGLSPKLSIVTDGQFPTLVATLGSTTYWKLPAGVTSFTTLIIAIYFTVPASITVTSKLSVDDISKTDSPGGVGSHKQLFRNMTVGGSVKTAGSIQVASPSATGLGTTLVYTRGASAAGYIPAMRRYRASGGALAADATAVSGFRETLVTGGGSAATIVFSIPANQIREGNYAVVSRMKTTVANVKLTATAVFGVGGSTGTTTLTAPVQFGAIGYVWSTLGVLSLPTVQLPSASTQPTSISLTATGGSGTQYLDELYLLDLTRGDVSIISAGTTKTRMWIDAADVDTIRNRPAIYLGTAADRSDAVGVLATQVIAFGNHDLDPSGASMLTVTDNVDDVAVTASFYRRWHTHAGS